MVSSIRSCGLAVPGSRPGPARSPPRTRPDRHRARGLALGLALLAIPRTARGENPCAGDVKTFCGSVEFGAGRVAKCLEEN
ncbi:MAG TPA: cysteine rich repeat-containing protein, partial [Terriglobales bacterium]|nr:cysteine rich repeat-containing protein [Terriglobales bacterium]